MTAWIRTEDTLPPSGVSVLCLSWTSLGKSRRWVGKYVKDKTEEEPPDSDIGEWCEETEAYWTPEGWYENCVHWDEFCCFALVDTDAPTHWMSLPALPGKEDDPS